MDNKRLEALAKLIARDLFTNGNGTHAKRLVLEGEQPIDGGLGGWSEQALADRIADYLRESRSERGRPAQRGDPAWSHRETR